MRVSPTARFAHVGNSCVEALSRTEVRPPRHTAAPPMEDPYCRQEGWPARHTAAPPMEDPYCRQEGWHVSCERPPPHPGPLHWGAGRLGRAQLRPASVAVGDSSVILLTPPLDPYRNAY